MQLKGRSWAIEVTSVVDAAAIKLPEQLRRVADEVEQRARDEDTLRRGYLIRSQADVMVVAGEDELKGP